MHPDDKYPWRTRDELFETIRWQRVELDNLHERIRKLESKQVDYKQVDGWIPVSELDAYAEGLPP